jgi:transmembrane sensor
MDEQPRKVERALGAMREDVWGDLQHRRVAKRLDEALARPPGRAARRWFWGMAAAALSVLLAVFATRLRKGRTIVAEGAAIGSDVAATSAALSDGSEVDVGRGGQVQIVADGPDETRIELVAGRAEFEVAKRPNRPFVTTIRGVEVRVIGTHFSTELDLSHPPGVVRVTVHRGVVEVRRHPGEAASRLGADDRLDVPLDAVPSSAPAPVENNSAPSAPGSSSASSSATAPIMSAPAPLDASKLFEAAKAARAAGDIEGAARFYASLLKQFPGDERVGVAALELGRLRMDAQHAYRPAAEAFRRAIAKAPNEGVREDALARLVEVVDLLHDHDSCLAERGNYLQRYPKGVHVSRVERACGER